MRVYQPTREELQDRLERLIASSRTTREDLEERALAGALSAEEYWLWEEIRSNEFLLGGDRHH